MRYTRKACLFYKGQFDAAFEELARLQATADVAAEAARSEMLQQLAACRRYAALVRAAVAKSQSETLAHHTYGRHGVDRRLDELCGRQMELMADALVWHLN